ncbi:AmmeMemoRadiSam system radical SAM enzyme [Methanobacterium formicicum]|uniref:Radical SAM domain-containing protein n=1 Tax=Methanobacterium formicicum (strain DSM 3637 / PP1) TaxID=1204725 RepID=K2REL7_METFP|nr:AmmeMemoRadiSam system radical SAM enzyme [Methanobacterium formicicum]EKF86819.1 Radical SAM domain-containing protein [Methanobacterium formicicum DSM 3637]
MKKEAILYEKLDGVLNCHICNRSCVISHGKTGFCGMRQNDNGTMYSLNYASASSVAVDPIEKKPLFHFYPGSLSFSMGSIGCNFRCPYCQNWSISQADLDEIGTRDIPPEEAIKMALDNNCQSISWTYNEPTMWFEYTYDSAKLAHKNDLKTVYVTNGYMSSESLDLIAPHLDAANVDLKGMSDKFYQELCQARLEPVLENIQAMHDKGIHLEITNLVIPGYNDSPEDLQSLVKFVADVDVNIPLHLTRFYPHYKMNLVPPTPVETLEKAYEMAREAGIKYVYVGNVPGSDGENTKCPNCGELLIQRDGFSVESNNLKKNKECPSCGTKINIKF